jgi:hypothetical protein
MLVLVAESVVVAFGPVAVPDVAVPVGIGFVVRDDGGDLFTTLPFPLYDPPKKLRAPPDRVE